MKRALLSRPLLVLAAALSFLLGPATAQEYPARPIRLVATVAPGGLTDVMARLLAAAMAKPLGQNVLVENMAGAGGALGLEHVAKRVPADGHTLAISSSLVIFPVFTKDMRFDPLTDLAPVGIVMDGVSLLASPYGAPWNTYDEMLAYAKANPGKLNFGTPGIQTQVTLNVEALKQKHGIQITNVPYQGAGPYMQALMANEVQLAMYGEFRAIPDSRDRKIKVIAVTGEKRLAAFPGAPTFLELGLPEIQNYWYPLVTTAGVSRPVIAKLNAALAAALQTPEIKGFAAKSGLKLIGSSPEAAAMRIAEESRFAFDIARKAGIKPQ